MSERLRGCLRYSTVKIVKVRCASSARLWTVVPRVGQVLANPRLGYVALPAQNSNAVIACILGGRRTEDDDAGLLACSVPRTCDAFT